MVSGAVRIVEGQSWSGGSSRSQVTQSMQNKYIKAHYCTRRAKIYTIVGTNPCRKDQGVQWGTRSAMPDRNGNRGSEDRIAGFEGSMLSLFRI